MGLQAMASVQKMISKWKAGVACIEIQHPPIYIHLQAMDYKQGRLKFYESGLSNEFFLSKISLAQT